MAGTVIKMTAWLLRQILCYPLFRPKIRRTAPERRSLRNVKKTADYSALYAALDTLMALDLPQMETYREIGRLICGRLEKGAAVAAAEYLHSTYPDVSGFSPRNLRRMRDFYLTYEDAQEIMAEAMTIGWTQNAVILEAELTLRERAWHIRAVRQFGWSKLKLAERIASSSHLEAALDLRSQTCCTEESTVGDRQPDLSPVMPQAGREDRKRFPERVEAEAVSNCGASTKRTAGSSLLYLTGLGILTVYVVAQTADFVKLLQKRLRLSQPYY